MNSRCRSYKGPEFYRYMTENQVQSHCESVFKVEPRGTCPTGVKFSELWIDIPSCKDDFDQHGFNLRSTAFQKEK